MEQMLMFSVGVVGLISYGVSYALQSDLTYPDKQIEFAKRVFLFRVGMLCWTAFWCGPPLVKLWLIGVGA